MRYCLNCRSELYRKHTFCSIKCRRIYYKQPLQCIICGKELIKKYGFYCQSPCKAEISELTKEKISKALSGRTCSEERNQKMIKTLKSKYSSGEYIQWNKGKDTSDPTVARICEKMREANTGRIQSPDERKKRSISRIEGLKSGRIKINAISASEKYFGQRIFEVYKIKLSSSFMLQGKCYDYKVPNRNILIECDGTYWHSKPENKINDSLKDLIAKENNFLLYRFNIDSKKDVDKLILENSLKNILK